VTTARAATTARPAEARDATAIARIYNHGIEDRVATFETEHRTPSQIEALLAERASRYPMVVVEREGEVIAWAGVGAYRSRPCYDGVAEFSVYVDRAHRSTGAGRAAMEALVSACQAKGFWKLVSRIFADNAISRAFHRRLDFREVGIYERHGKLDGVWKDCVIVERLIGEALR
jgi:L-amino acid N-acyltransferase YncA